GRGGARGGRRADVAGYPEPDRGAGAGQQEVLARCQCPQYGPRGRLLAGRQAGAVAGAGLPRGAPPPVPPNTEATPGSGVRPDPAFGLCIGGTPITESALNPRMGGTSMQKAEPSPARGSATAVRRRVGGR